VIIILKISYKTQRGSRRRVGRERTLLPPGRGAFEDADAAERKLRRCRRRRRRRRRRSRRRRRRRRLQPLQSTAAITTHARVRIKNAQE